MYERWKRWWSANWGRVIQIASALMIASAMFLPLASCREYQDENKRFVTHVMPDGTGFNCNGRESDEIPEGAVSVSDAAEKGQLPKNIKLDIKYYYMEFELNSVSGWMKIFVFVWPFFGITISFYYIYLRHGVLIDSIALALCLLTNTTLFDESIKYGQLECGYWISSAGILLLSGWLVYKLMLLSKVGKISRKNMLRLVASMILVALVMWPQLLIAWYEVL